MAATTNKYRKKTRRKKTNLPQHKFAMCAKKCKGSRNYRQCMSACLKGQ